MDFLPINAIPLHTKFVLYLLTPISTNNKQNKLPTAPIIVL